MRIPVFRASLQNLIPHFFTFFSVTKCIFHAFYGYIHRRPCFIIILILIIFNFCSFLKFIRVMTNLIPLFLSRKFLTEKMLQVFPERGHLHLLILRFRVPMLINTQSLVMRWSFMYYLMQFVCIFNSVTVPCAESLIIWARWLARCSIGLHLIPPSCCCYMSFVSL